MIGIKSHRALRGTRWLVGALCALTLTSHAGAQITESWYGALRVEYGPTGVTGSMMAHVLSSDEIGLAATCSSDRTDFTPCRLEVWGHFPRPARHVRYMVVRFYHGGERIFSDTVVRQDIILRSDGIGMVLDLSASSAAALWAAFADPEMLAIEFADANGLGNPIPYAQADLDIRPMPQLAINLVHTMRTADTRPIDWARDVLGPCAQMLDERGVVRRTMRGAAFEESACYEY